MTTEKNWLVTANKLLNIAYENRKNGQIYDIKEANKFCSLYQRDYIIWVLTILIKQRGYLREVLNDEPSRYTVLGYEITKKGMEFLFNDPTMKELNKQNY